MPEASSTAVEQTLAVVNAARLPQQIAEVFRAAGITATIAGRIITVRNALPARRFSTIPELAAVPGVGPTVAAAMVDVARTLAWTDRPVLLLPVRIETRFVGSELLVRIYPDQIFVNAHDPRLTPPELDAGKTYRDAKAADPQGAWRELARRVGPKRAAWVAKVFSGPAAFRPPLKPGAGNWFTSPQLAALPERFYVHLYRDNMLVRPPVAGKPIAGTFTTLGDPAKGATGLFDGDAKWIVDFNTAEDRGMAVRVQSLTQQDLEKGFSPVIVVGMRAGGAEAGGQALETLIESHHYGVGFGFVPYGTPTNNTQKAKSGHSASAEDREGSFAIEITGSGEWPPLANAERFGHAVGFGAAPACLRCVEHADSNEDSYAGDMQTALWPVTGDYLLRFLLPGTGANRELLGTHFSRFVRGAGPLPSIRVGEQPYGVLPVTRVNGWQASAADNAELAAGVAFDTALHKALQGLQARWLAFANDPERVPRVRAEGDPDKELLQILSMQPVSASYQARAFVDERFIGWLLTAMRSYIFGPDTPYGELSDSPLLWVQSWAEEWQQLREGQARLWNGWTGVPEAAMASSPLLRLTGWWFARDLETDLNTPLVSRTGEPAEDSPATYLDALLIPDRTSNSTALLYDLLQRSLALSALPLVRLQAVKDAIGRLAERADSIDLDRLLREALDLCHSRLDAWLTSLATKRLHAMREALPTGVHLGAFGYVEGLTREEHRGSAGHLHAPSRGQAAAAAILHNAYLTHAGGPSEANPFRINLNSERVRRAARILEGIRQGQPLGVLLGYQFERQLHERKHDRFIDDFRAAFPLVANKETEPLPGDAVVAVAARNVVDGLALARWKQHPARTDIVTGGRMSLDQVAALEAAHAPIREEIQRVLDSLDAVSDVLMYESIFHAANGNFERGGAALDAASGQGYPPRLESVTTPVPAKPIGHRVCLLLRPADGESTGPRGRIEPRVAGWAADLFGDLAQIGCRYTFRTPRFNVNAAEAETLMLVPGISASQAAAIVTHREQHGKFKTVNDLTAVPSIANATLAAIRRWIMIGSEEVEDQRTYARIDINSAAAAELEELPGIEAQAAAAIVAQRPIRRIADLIGVGGLDAAAVEHLRRFAMCGEILGLHELGIEAVDLLAMSALPLSGAVSEIEARIHYFVRTEHLLPHDQRVSIPATRVDGFAYGLEEALELGRQALTLLGAARPLRPDALCLPSRGTVAMFSAAEVTAFDSRITTALAELGLLMDGLRVGPSSALLAALLEASQYGVAGAIPGAALDPELPRRRDDTLVELERRRSAAVRHRAEAFPPADKPQPSRERQVELLIEAAKELFGRATVMLPVFEAPDWAALSETFGKDDVLLGSALDGHRVRLWLQQLARVRKPLAALDDTMTMAEAWRQSSARAALPPMALKVAQLPSARAGRWLALDDHERGVPMHADINSARGVLSVVAATNDDRAALPRQLCGLLVDQWDERIPASKLDTSVAFQYDSPGAQAPQSLLLAVPGERRLGKLWSNNELAEIVKDTMDLAKVRAVDLDAMARRETDPPDEPGVGAVLPALMFPTDPSKPGWTRTAFADTINDWVAAIEEVKPRCIHGRLEYPRLVTPETTWTLHFPQEYPMRRYARGISSSQIAGYENVEVRGDAGDFSKRLYVKDYLVHQHPHVEESAEVVVRVVGSSFNVDFDVASADGTIYTLQGGLALELGSLASCRVRVFGHVYPGSYPSSRNVWVSRYEILSISTSGPPTAIGIVDWGIEGVFLREWAADGPGDTSWWIHGGAGLLQSLKEKAGSKIWLFGTKSTTSAGTTTGSGSIIVSAGSSTTSASGPTITGVSRYGVLREAAAIVPC